ncbi:hypothetical protein [Bacillus altitudinis]|uniref:hypothetical protein n=1 Tax=Bacillus altitudinis TaxID=293387 RepID=UPI0016437A85|nr:hypothetical protein [Bacillus altitudinis]
MEETEEMVDLGGGEKMGGEIEVMKGKEVDEGYEGVVKSDVGYGFVIDIWRL